ncbi:MAG TPA: aminopeptidase P family protein [Oscillospiraceae bacterium]|nr:aminopeptidase P family protein [Oscillospiraceae bacterium]
MDRLNVLRKQLQLEGREAILVANPINVAYLSGFTGTAGSLLITNSQAYLLTDFRYVEQAQQQAPAFETIDTKNKLWPLAADLLADNACQTLTVEADYLTVDTYEEVVTGLAAIAVEAAASPVTPIRVVKTAEEIKAMEKAQKLTDAAFSQILEQIKPGVRERELALELEFMMRRGGASGLSFTMIVGSGSRSALPHGVASEKILAVGDAVVLDYGCIVDGYCSDMTRTVFVGQASDKQREVYQLVLAAQEAALAKLQAGVSGRDGDAFAREVITAAGYGEYFGHGLGHGVGREIHESPRLSASYEGLLEPGMIVTVEPGIYLPGEFGVRIEDMVVIEEQGIRNLTASSKELYCL